MLQFEFSAAAKAHMHMGRLLPSDVLGDIPAWLDEADPASAIEQIHRMYAPIGGGWRDSRGPFALDEENNELRYPGDPPMILLAKATLRDERIFIFDCSWVVVLLPSGTFRVARID